MPEPSPSIDSAPTAARRLGILSRVTNRSFAGSQFVCMGASGSNSQCAALLAGCGARVTVLHGALPSGTPPAVFATADFVLTDRPEDALRAQEIIVRTASDRAVLRPNAAPVLIVDRFARVLHQSGSVEQGTGQGPRQAQSQGKQGQQSPLSESAPSTPAWQQVDRG